MGSIDELEQHIEQEQGIANIGLERLEAVGIEHLASKLMADRHSTKQAVDMPRFVEHMLPINLILMTWDQIRLLLAHALHQICWSRLVVVSGDNSCLLLSSYSSVSYGATSDDKRNDENPPKPPSNDSSCTPPKHTIVVMWRMIIVIVIILVTVVSCITNLGISILFSKLST